MRMARCGAAALVLVFISLGASAQQNVTIQLIEAGPIGSNDDAQTKCWNVARAHGATWGGALVDDSPRTDVCLRDPAFICWRAGRIAAALDGRLKAPTVPLLRRAKGATPASATSSMAS